MGFFESLIREAHMGIDCDWVYTIYDKRDGSFVCNGIEKTMEEAERTAREVLSRLKYKKHYGIIMTMGE